MSTLTWTPPGGSALIFTGGDYDNARRLLDMRGLGPIQVSPFAVKGPRQPGTTLVDAVVPPRIVELDALLQEATNAALWSSRIAVASSMAVQPARLTEQFAMGELAVAITDGPSRVIDAMVASAEFIRGRGAGAWTTLSAEFYCPSPWWKATSDSSQVFAAGETFALDNPGDVDCPITVVATGGTVTVRNNTTGESIVVSGAPSAVTITTGFGNKQILAGGANAMKYLTVASSTMWQLRPGSNSVTVTGAGATVSWRPLYAGI